MTTRKQEYKETLLLGFITCKALNCKALRTKLFEGGYYVMIQGGIYGTKCTLHDPNGGIHGG